jgi:DHA1 family vesicular acetylcholine transporter-like MFS transporter 3
MGRQIGFAVAGVSIGTTIAPPIGGALYWHLGWHAPFIFTIIICAVDLLLRLLVIEQKELPPIETPHQLQADREKTPTPATEAGQGLETSCPPDASASVKELSPWGVLVALAKSPRGMNGFIATFIYGLAIGALDPT